MSDQNKTKAQLLAEIATLKESLNDLRHHLKLFREGEEHYYSLFQDSAVGMVVVVPDGRITQSNRAFCDFLGYSEQELFGKTVLSITHPDDREASSQAIRQSFTKGSRIQRVDKRYLSKSGRVLWGEVSATVICDAEGKPSYYVAQVLDINERKQAEEALRISEAKYRRLYESMMDAFASVNMDGFVREFNQAFCQMLGYEPGEIIKLHYTDITPEKWHSMQAEIIEKQVLTRGYSEIYEKEYRRKDGTIFPVELRNCLIKDETGQPAGIWAIVRDITERKRAEEILREANNELERKVQERTAELQDSYAALRQSEQRFRSYFEQGLMGMAISTGDTNWTEVNERFCEIIEYSREEIVQRKRTDFIHPDDMESARKDYARLLTGETDHYTADRRYVRKDGKVIYLTVFIKVFRSKEGMVDSILGLFDDVTERKRTVEALRQSHDELRAIYESTFDGFMIVDVESKHLLKVNASLCRMLRYSEAELRSMSVGDIHPPEEVSLALSTIEARATGKYKGYVSISFLRKDGGIFFADVVSSLITYGGRLCLAAFVHDVTEKKQTEEALRQSHDELQAIYDGMVDGLIVADVDTKRFVKANAAVCQMLGYSMQELLSKSVVDIHPSEDLRAILKTFQAQSAGQITINENAPVLRKDGSVFYADIATNRIVYDLRPHLIGFFRDISERKRAYEALQKERRTLKHLLQSSDHERRLIAYEIHDGLAQYLAGAIMQFQTYSHLKDTEPELAAKAHDAGVTMVQQGHFEARRLIAGVRPPILDEAGVVEAVAHLINEKNLENGPQIEFNGNVKFSRLVLILENAIYRICQEGLSNACKYSQSKKVLVNLLQPNDQIHIEIRDWGTGFNPKKVKGNRFGLIGIRERARLLGGKFRIQSAAGKGTRITVELPVMEREDT